MAVSSCAGTRPLVLGPRWLTLVLFLPMVFASSLGVPGATEVTTWCGVAWLGGGVLLIGASDKPVRSTLWMWVMLFVFLMGYYLKFFLFSYGMGTPIFDYLMHELAWADRRDLQDSLVISTFGFIAFAVVAAALLRGTNLNPLKPPPASDRVNPRALTWLLVLTFIGVVISLGVALVFGFGQMGVEHQALPFRLDAVFTRFRISLAPAIFVTALWVSDNRKTQGVWMLGLALTALSAVLDAYVRGSRGSIALAFLPLMFLWGVSGTFSQARKVLSLAVVVLTFALFPIFTMVRGERIAASQEREIDREAVAQEAVSSEGLTFAFNTVAGRVMGIDSMMQIAQDSRPSPTAIAGVTSISPSRLTWLASGGQMVQYMTHTVVGIPLDVIEGRSPGFLGGFYIVGGTDGMVLLTVLYTGLVVLIWRRIASHRYAAPLLAYVAAVLMSYTQEGVFGLENPLSTALAILATVWLFRRFIVAKESNALS